jgi:citrate lyase subunit beta / citryl-CoA lyase
MKLRSLLYVPAHEERFIAKAHERGADGIILDLEDAVPMDAKVPARDRLFDTIRRVSRKGARVFVRINSEPELQRHDADTACAAGAYGIFIAKAEDPRTIQTLANQASVVESGRLREPLRFIPMIESPGAVLDARQLARHPRVMGLSVGAEDLALGMGAEPIPEVLRMPKFMVHIAAKAEGKLSFGTLSSIADYSDLDRLRASAVEARQFGFDGASCVHPSAVSVLNDAFAPSEAQLDWAGRVIEAHRANGGKSVFSIDGKMVDAPVLARAEAILARR